MVFLTKTLCFDFLDAVVLALEYCNRGSLQDVVDLYGELPEDFIKSMLFEVVQGLNEIHIKKKMHRDIKPQNILVSHNGHVKIADFGIIGSASEDDMLNTFTGTTLYMSPERLAGGSYTNAGDIWSLGLVVIVCATKVFPFTFKNNGAGYWGVTQAIMEKPSPNIDSTNYSEELKDFVRMCMEKDPFERATAQQLLSHPLLKDFQNTSNSRTYSEEINKILKPSPDRVKADVADLKDLLIKIGSAVFWFVYSFSIFLE